MKWVHANSEHIERIITLCLHSRRTLLPLNAIAVIILLVNIIILTIHYSFTAVYDGIDV
jgi:hypothetical protein